MVSPPHDRGSALDHVIRLSRIDPPPEARDRLTGELERILRFMEQFRALDTRDVPPTAHPHAFENHPRPDRPRPGLAPAEALQNAPEVAEGALFTTPRIVDG